MAALKRLHTPLAWVDGRWQRDVLLSVDANGHWSDITVNLPAPADAELLGGPFIPSLVNAHSHAFQRAFVGLAERGRDLVSTYSGGMKRRLNLAVAVVHEPELVVLDEPTVGVDPQSRNLIFENIRALRDQGRTLVYTTHYMEEAERLCDRVGILDQGRLLALDTVAGLLRAHVGPTVLAVEVEADGAEAVAERLVPTDDPLRELNAIASRERVRAFRVERPDLEQVFLRLTGRHLRD